MHKYLKDHGRDGVGDELEVVEELRELGGALGHRQRDDLDEALGPEGLADSIGGRNRDLDGVLLSERRARRAGA